MYNTMFAAAMHLRNHHERSRKNNHDGTHKHSHPHPRAFRVVRAVAAVALHFLFVPHSCVFALSSSRSSPLPGMQQHLPRCHHMPSHPRVHTLSLSSDIGSSSYYSAVHDASCPNDIVSQQCQKPPHFLQWHHIHPVISSMSIDTSTRGSSCSSSFPSPTFSSSSSPSSSSSISSAASSASTSSSTTRSAPVHNLSNRTFSSLSALVVNDSAGYAVSPDGRLRIPLTASLRARQCTATSHLRNRQRRSDHHHHHHGQFISSSLSSSSSSASSSSSRFQSDSKTETETNHNHRHDPSPSTTTKTTTKITNDPLTSVVVYVIDTGCRVSHRELYPRAISLPAPGSPYVSGADDHGHGTHVAARIAGLSFGLAPHARIVCVKALSRHNEGSSKDVVSALNLVIRLHTHAMREQQKIRRRSVVASAAVVCISLGVAAPRRYTDLDKAVTRASRHGILSVVAAGNSARNACHFTPARAPGALSIAAASQSATSHISSLSSSSSSSSLANKQRDRGVKKKKVKQNHHVMVTSGRALAPFSNFGPCVTVAAPGVHVWSAVASGDDAYGVSSGTSMAAPFVAGLIALVQRTHGAVSHGFVVAMLRDMATSVDGVPVVSVDGLCRWLGVGDDNGGNKNDNDNVDVNGDNKEDIESRHSNHRSLSQSQFQPQPSPHADAAELTPPEDNRNQQAAQHEQEQEHEQQKETETEEQGHQGREQRRRRHLTSRFRHWYKTREGNGPGGVGVVDNNDDATGARPTGRELHVDANNHDHHNGVGHFRNDDDHSAASAAYRAYHQRGRRVDVDSEQQQQQQQKRLRERYERHHHRYYVQRKQRQMRRQQQQRQRRVRDIYRGGTTGERVRVVHVDDNDNDMDIDWDVDMDMNTKVDVNDNDTVDTDSHMDMDMDVDVGTTIPAGSVATATAATTGDREEKEKEEGNKEVKWRQMRGSARRHQYRGTWSKFDRASP